MASVTPATSLLPIGCAPSGIIDRVFLPVIPSVVRDQQQVTSRLFVTMQSNNSNVNMKASRDCDNGMAAVVAHSAAGAGTVLPVSITSTRACQVSMMRRAKPRVGGGLNDNDSVGEKMCDVHTPPPPPSSTTHTMKPRATVCCTSTALNMNNHHQHDEKTNPILNDATIVMNSTDDSTYRTTSRRPVAKSTAIVTRQVAVNDSCAEEAACWSTNNNNNVAASSNGNIMKNHTMVAGDNSAKVCADSDCTRPAGGDVVVPAPAPVPTARSVSFDDLLRGFNTLQQAGVVDAILCGNADAGEDDDVTMMATSEDVQLPLAATTSCGVQATAAARTAVNFANGAAFAVPVSVTSQCF